MWRDARPGDDEAVIALCRALYEEDPAGKPVPDEHHRRTVAELRVSPARGRVVVLDEDVDVIGYAILVACWSNELGGEVLIIDELYVVPEQRSRGHARSLIEALVRGEGPWPGTPVALELEVTPDNARARALYERLGFKVKRNAVLRAVLG